MGRFGSAAAELFDRDETETEFEPSEPEPQPDPEPVEAELVIDEEDELTLEELAGEDPKPAGEEAEDEDVSEMFARLRKEAKKNSG